MREFRAISEGNNKNQLTVFSLLFVMTLLTLVFSDVVYAAQENKEKIVLVDGITQSLTGRCGFENCRDRENYLKDIVKSEMEKGNIEAEIEAFNWSGDMVAHKEDLKNKFRNWFYSNVCKEGDNCKVSFIAHSWGTIIATDFISSMSESTSIKVRTVVTLGSPVTGAHIAFGKDAFWQTAISKVTSDRNKIDNIPARWVNVVNKEDPIAWDLLDNGWFWHSKIPGIENLKPDGTLSTKGRIDETFHVSNSELDYTYLINTILVTSPLISYINDGKELLKVIINSWDNNSGLNFNAHDVENYQPERLVKYVTDRMMPVMSASSSGVISNDNASFIYILSISPASGDNNDVIIIKGVNFSDSTGRVHFESCPDANITSWKDDEIIVTVPKCPFSGNTNVFVETSSELISNKISFTNNGNYDRANNGNYDRAIFVNENYPDNTKVAGGTSLTKVWTVKNTGTTTWNSSYKLQYVSNSRGRLSTVDEVSVSGSVLPNALYSFKVPMTTPYVQSSDKTYIEVWKLSNPSGSTVNVSISPTVWAQVVVQAVQLGDKANFYGGELPLAGGIGAAILTKADRLKAEAKARAAADAFRDQQELAEAKARAQAQAGKEAKEKAEEKARAKAKAEKDAKEKAEAKARAEADALRDQQELDEAKERAKKDAEKDAKEKAEARERAQAQAEKEANEKAEAKERAKEKAEKEARQKAEAKERAKKNAEKKKKK